MSSRISAAIGRLRHVWLEAAMAGGLTMMAFTAAYATSVEPAPVIAARAPAPVAEAVAAVEEPVFEYGEPVPGHSVNSPFGLRRMPWEKQGRLHEGVDIAAPTGASVVAVADGVITRAGESASYGRFVEVKHAEGLVSFYAHLGRIDAKAQPGVAVVGGTMIGKIGSSGTSTGPHLHFEIRRDDRPLNPVAFIGREFESAEDLPLKTAARYSSRVRIAQVSFIPEEKRALVAPANAVKTAKATAGARPRATLSFTAKSADDAAVPASATVPEDSEVRPAD